MSAAIILGSVVTFGGYGIAGIFALVQMYSKSNQKRVSDNDQTATNLINNLKTTVDLQEKAIKENKALLDKTTKELHQMEGRNSVLESLFNGSENSILAFLKQAPVLMDIAKENHELATANNKAITDLTNTMNNFLLHIMPLMEKPVLPAPVTSQPVQKTDG